MGGLGVGGHLIIMFKETHVDLCEQALKISINGQRRHPEHLNFSRHLFQDGHSSSVACTVPSWVAHAQKANMKDSPSIVCVCVDSTGVS